MDKCKWDYEDGYDEGWEVAIEHKKLGTKRTI